MSNKGGADPPPKVRGKSRIQLDLTDRQFEALKRIQAYTDCASYSEVFRRALVIMDKIVEKEQGGTVNFGFVNEDMSEFTQVWFI